MQNILDEMYVCIVCIDGIRTWKRRYEIEKNYGEKLLVFYNHAKQK
jgi:hypothetical protein